MNARAQVRELLARHELRAKRSFGQNFLIDDRVLDDIARAAAEDEPAVVEIGAGLGTLTAALARHAPRVVAIERDRSLIPVLRELFADTPLVSIVEGDAQSIDFAAAAGIERPAIAGNLPYSITTPLLLVLLGQRASIGPATVMIQREVADRLAADVDTREYGSLTILFRIHADIEKLFDVPPSCFMPAPKVTSTVLQLRWLPAPRIAVPDPAHLERVVRASFAQRRKTLRNSLATAFDKAAIARAGEAANIALERRAETLDLEEFARLASHLPR